jgi:hypothetical protein
MKKPKKTGKTTKKNAIESPYTKDNASGNDNLLPKKMSWVKSWAVWMAEHGYNPHRGNETERKAPIFSFQDALYIPAINNLKNNNLRFYTDLIIELGLLKKRNECAICLKQMNIKNYYIQLCKECRMKVIHDFYKKNRILK